MGQGLRASSGEGPVIALARRVVNPATVVFSLLLCMLLVGNKATAYYWMLAILSFLLSAEVFGEVPLARNEFSAMLHRRRLFMEWAMVVGILLFIGFATKLSSVFSRKLILTWICVTPFLLIAAQSALRRALPALVANGSRARTALVVGVNPIGLEFARRVSHNPYVPDVRGFFDDRSPERLAPGFCPQQLLGTLSDLSNYVRKNSVTLIYISLPIVARPRIKRLLHDLKDTTASVYFIPDLFSFDLIQARLDEINGIPVVAVRESPFCGLNGVLKQGSDIVLASLILLCIWPVLLIVAVGVKLSSPGPVLFKQRRYGLGGKEIVVHKFRTMTVCEDGAQIVQAKKDDERLTRFGAWLRRTSLDELPQFINVLQGTMSIVGPRPHAVAHNESYRKLIDGYMLRHKVKPGITGLAQVNGFRGETESVEQMKKRVEYDLNYLRHWSLALDLEIIWRTALTVWRDRRAY